MTNQPIKVFLSGDIVPRDRVSPFQAAILVKSGVFMGVGSDSRIKHIREIDPRPPLPFQPGWHTTGGSAVYPPSPGYYESRVSRPGVTL